MCVCVSLYASSCALGRYSCGSHCVCANLVIICTLCSHADTIRDAAADARLRSNTAMPSSERPLRNLGSRVMSAGSSDFDLASDKPSEGDTGDAGTGYGIRCV